MLVAVQLVSMLMLVTVVLVAAVHPSPVFIVKNNGGNQSASSPASYLGPFSRSMSIIIIVLKSQYKITQKSGLSESGSGLT